MARLEVRWSGDPKGEVAVALAGLGLEEAGGGHYVAEGEGRTLIRVVGTLRDLQSRVHSEGQDDLLTVHFVDPAD